MSPTSKWIEDFAPDSDVAAVARAAVEMRLAAVSYWLPAAAYCADHDVEHVHHLRVSTRRALAALKLFRDWLPRKRARRVKRLLKKIRQAAGMARDLDVFAERLQECEIEGRELAAAEVATRRRDVQPEIEQLADRLRRRDKLGRRLNKLLAGFKPGGGGTGDGQRIEYGHWAKEQLAREAAIFFDADPEEKNDTAALHQFRIAGKRLRYVIELLACGLDSEIRNTQYRIVEELQEKLGGINDHAWAADQLREWAANTTDSVCVQVFQAIAHYETQHLETALREYDEWWTTERAQSLRSGLGIDTVPSESARRTVLVS